MRWIAFVAFLFLAVFFIFGQANIAARRKHLDSVQAELRVFSEVQQTKYKLDTLSNFAREIKGRNVPVAGLMKKLSMSVPAGIIFTEMNLDFDLKSGYINGSVRVNEEKALTKLVDESNSSGFFADAAIDILEKNGTAEEGQKSNFKIVFKFP